MQTAAGDLIGLLQILLTIYQFRKPQRLVKVIEELISELRSAREIDQPRKYLSERVVEKLGASQAKEIEQDLDVIEILTSPPTLGSFDYWGILTQFVGGIHTLALKGEMFRLRGKPFYNLRILPLPSVGPAILPQAKIQAAYTPKQDYHQAELEWYVAALTEMSDGLPIIILASGKLVKHSPLGYGYSEIKPCTGVLCVERGIEAHWLSFVPLQQYPCLDSTSWMLKADDVQNIIGALKKDIASYAQDIKTNQRRVETEIQPEITKFFSQIDAEKR